MSKLWFNNWERTASLLICVQFVVHVHKIGSNEYQHGLEWLTVIKTWGLYGFEFHDLNIQKYKKVKAVHDNNINTCNVI